MKIAVPMANGQLCMHFGHCETFAMVEVDETSRRITGTQVLVPPPHAPGVLPAWLHEQGARMVIAGGMGMRAQELFARNGIQVLVGAPSQTPQALVEAFLAGTLVSGRNVCDH